MLGEKAVYRLRLGKAYFERGFFNLGLEVSDFVTDSEGRGVLLLGGERERLYCRIDRSSNVNGTPRIHGGKRLTDWLQKNFMFGSYLEVTIMEPNVFLLMPVEEELDSLKRFFLSRMEGFKSFSEDKARQGHYWRTERAYKEEMVYIYQSTIREELRSPARGDQEELTLFDNVRTLFIKPLPDSGHMQNLWNWRVSGFFGSLKSNEEKIKFLNALRDLCFGKDAVASRAMAFSRKLEGLIEPYDKKIVEPARTRDIPLLFLMLHNPEQIFMLRSVPLQKALKIILKQQQLSGPMNESQFEDIQRLGEKTFSILSEWGWKPQDMIDVQGFLWVTCSGTYEDQELEMEDEELREEPSMNEINTVPLNQILYGPPGTGKTYRTIDKALEILDPDFLQSNSSNRIALKGRYDELLEEGRVRFVTFHQSFSYEDFVEGIRATQNENGDLSYEIQDGIFKQICKAASVQVTKSVSADIDISNRTVWKMSLGAAVGEEYVYEECIENNYVLLGWGEDIDFAQCQNIDDVRRAYESHDRDVARTTYAISAVNLFRNYMRPGDLIVVTEGNHKFRAIGEIKGDYRLLEQDRNEYRQCRDVEWLKVYSPALPKERIMRKDFSQMSLYLLRDQAISRDKLQSLLAGSSKSVASEARFRAGDQLGKYEVVFASADILRISKPNGHQVGFDMNVIKELAGHIAAGQLTLEDIKQKRVFDKVETKLEKYIVNGYENILPSIVERYLETQVASSSDKWVLIIDEINRGNVSRILGELITLLEDTKREGADEDLQVTLPYSKEPFTVPSNVHLVGTMNTADRSIAGLDIALRRRFEFVELPPQPELLSEVIVDGVSVEQLLSVINGRIEALLDRDHLIGHAYFMGMKENSLEELSDIFRLKIIPLLQEYFFEDWERIHWVLNDHRKEQPFKFVNRPDNFAPVELFGADVGADMQDRRWSLNNEAFGHIESFRGIIEAEQ